MLNFSELVFHYRDTGTTDYRYASCL